MSLNSLIISEEYDTKTDNAMATYHSLGEYPTYALYYVSTMFVNIQQLKSNLNTEHKHEKNILDQLNERLRIYVDRVQQLELQNEKYAAKVSDLRRQSSNVSIFDTEWNERYTYQQTGLMTVNSEKSNYEFEFELFQMQSEIYKQLIQIINQSNDEQRLALQQELDRSSSTLISLRTSHADLQKKIESLHLEREGTFQQYLNMTQKWNICRKQTSDLKINLQALKNQNVFYQNNIRSYEKSDSIAIEAFDIEKFWASKWQKIIANIRRDYELLYGSIYRDITIYYEKKIEEVQVEVEQTSIEQTKYYEQVGSKRLEFIQQTIQLEHEEALKSYAYEKEILMKYEATYSKLESEFESIQLQQKELFEKQLKEVDIFQGSIMTMVDNIEEMRRRKISLESELIIYRHLLELDEIQKQVIIDSSSVVRNTTMRTFVIESQEMASIGIECPIDSTYICLVNHSSRKNIDISQWILKRRVDSKTEFQYTLPDGVQLPAGGELRIYSKLGAEAAQLSSNYEFISSSLNQKLVNDKVISWVVGDRIETRLFDQNGDEKASFIQVATSDETVSS